MKTPAKCIIYVAEDCFLSLFVGSFLFPVFFHQEKKTISVTEITTVHHDKELSALKAKLMGFGFNYVNHTEVDFSDYDYVIAYYGKAQNADVITKEFVVREQLGIPLDETEKRLKNSKEWRIFRCAQTCYKELAELGVPKSKIIPCTLLCNSDFSIDILPKLFDNPLSILANQCFGRYTYFNLGIPFYSPFENIVIDSHDFLKILLNPRELISSSLDFYKFEEADGKKIPIAILDKGGADVKIQCTHYSDFESFEKVWHKRVPRINYDNLFGVLTTTDANDIKDFSKVPFKKFALLQGNSLEGNRFFDIDFENNVIIIEPSGYIEWVKKKYGNCHIKEDDFGSIANHMGMRELPFFSLIDLVLEGKITIVQDVQTEITLNDYTGAVVFA